MEPPAVAEQIVDHVNAYLACVACLRPSGGMSSFFAVAGRNPDFHARFASRLAGNKARPCTSSNHVAEIGYRASDVDDAVYAAMNELMGPPHYVGSALQALWTYVVTDPRWDHSRNDEMGHCRVIEERMHAHFWQVSAISKPIFDLAASKIGCNDCSRTAPSPKPAIAIGVIQAALDAMGEGRKEEDGARVYGIPALHGPSHLTNLDPHLIVALSRAARGSISDTPSLEDTLAALAAMGITVTGRPAS